LILRADARRIPLADNSVQCVVTSPPYWSLRKYAGAQELSWGGVWRGAYGLEPDVGMYVDHTVEILREVRRVLRPDGVCFWNIGDSYAQRGGEGYKGRKRWQHTGGRAGLKPQDWEDNVQVRDLGESGLKAKDLCLIPFRVALAAQVDGWWVRSDIIWSKNNPMPESVTDRPTNSHEHILMLTKSADYFWDQDAVREPHLPESVARRGRARTGGKYKNSSGGQPGNPHSITTGLDHCLHPNGRNLRSVWTFPSQPYPEAHFATFPEELPARCIRAATSERGACVECGAPWERIVERTGHVNQREPAHAPHSGPGRVECAACGALARVRLRITGKGERCHFCSEPDHRGRFPAGKLCEQGEEL